MQYAILVRQAEPRHAARRMFSAGAPARPYERASRQRRRGRARRRMRAARAVRREKCRLSRVRKLYRYRYEVPATARGSHGVPELCSEISELCSEVSGLEPRETLPNIKKSLRGANSETRCDNKSPHREQTVRHRATATYTNHDCSLSNDKKPNDTKLKSGSMIRPTDRASRGAREATSGEKGHKRAGSW